MFCEILVSFVKRTIGHVKGKIDTLNVGYILFGFTKWLFV